ncbi:MAG: hypothetical protein AAGE52_32565 [Myxococcota bacterium]
MRRPLLVAIAFLLVASNVDAQSLEDAEASYRNGEFEAAGATLDALLEGDNLDRSQVVAVYALRARVHHAERNDAGVEETLSALLSLDPNATLRDAPPSLSRRVEALRGEVRTPLALALDRRRDGNDEEVSLRVTGDLARIVRQVQVRLESDEWRPRSGTQHLLAPGTRFVAEVIGPGGAVLAFEGTQQAPLFVEGEVTPATPVARIEEDEEPRSIWRWLAPVLLVVIAGAALGVGLALRDDGVRTDLTPPMRVP